MALTKILKFDLGFELQELIADLENSKGTKASLTERLNDLDTLLASDGWIQINMLDLDIKNVIQNLLDGEAASGKTIVERVGGLETRVTNLESSSTTADVASLKTKVKMLGEYGNFNETFTYDANGNVTKHTVTGDVAFTIDYVYADPVAGTLNYSEKKYVDENGKNVTIHKQYTYDASGNITSITTITTIA
jgi:hypothetical protein